MTAWSTLEDIRQLLKKRWQRGDWLRESVSPGLIPFRVPLKHPDSRQLVEQFDEARLWVKNVQEWAVSMNGRLQWKTVHHRLLGDNTLPVAVVFESLDDVIKGLRVSGQRDDFVTLYQQVVADFPDLSPWLLKHPHRLLECGEAVTRLLTVVQWLQKHGPPRCYLRQLPLPGIDSKFIEQHRKILGEWLDCLLPAIALDERYTGISGFERRYGFLDRPRQVRFRLLDRRQFITGFSDLTVRVDELAKREIFVETVYVTENDINGLAFPEMANAMVLFGRGYGFDGLGEIAWLQDKRIVYWGDIDTDGFAILNQFRGIFPQAETLLMDRKTLMANQDFWSRDDSKKAHLPEPHRLIDEEFSLYQDLYCDRLGENVRLEQERIPFDALLGALGGF